MLGRSTAQVKCYVWKFYRGAKVFEAVLSPMKNCFVDALVRLRRVDFIEDTFCQSNINNWII